MLLEVREPDTKNIRKLKERNKLERSTSMTPFQEALQLNTIEGFSLYDHARMLVYANIQLIPGKPSKALDTLRVKFMNNFHIFNKAYQQKNNGKSLSIDKYIKYWPTLLKQARGQAIDPEKVNSIVSTIPLTIQTGSQTRTGARTLVVLVYLSRAALNASLYGSSRIVGTKQGSILSN